MGKIKDFPKQKMADALQAKKQMQSLPIPALISTINMMLEILHDRGYDVHDWDRKEKTFYKLTFIGGSVYALCVSKPPDACPAVKETTTNAKNPTNHPGK